MQASNQVTAVLFRTLNMEIKVLHLICLLSSVYYVVNYLFTPHLFTWRTCQEQAEIQEIHQSRYHSSWGVISWSVGNLCCKRNTSELTQPAGSLWGGRWRGSCRQEAAAGGLWNSTQWHHETPKMACFDSVFHQQYQQQNNQFSRT